MVDRYAADKRDGLSKEGSGRVGIYFATGITHWLDTIAQYNNIIANHHNYSAMTCASYTLECNYNMGRHVNELATPFNTTTTSDPHWPVTTPPPRSSHDTTVAMLAMIRYTEEMFEDVGRGLALALADLSSCNPQCANHTPPRS